jgi:hypothetical protein
MTRTLLFPARRLLKASIWQNQKLPAGTSRAQLIVDNSTMPAGWIVKSVHSGQGSVPGDQSTFNDYVGSRIAEAAGFTVGEVAVMVMNDAFLDGYPHLRTPSFGSFTPGEHYAVKYYPGSQTLDHYYSPLLRNELRTKCINPHTANEAVALDSGTVNWDRSIPMAGLQSENPANFLVRPARSGSGLELTLIDQGYCFGANWDTRNPPIGPHSIDAWPDAVFGVFKGLALINFYDQGDIMSQLSKLQSLTVADINSIIQEVPASWLGFTNTSDLNLLVSAITRRIAGYGRIITSQFLSVHTHALVKV